MEENKLRQYEAAKRALQGKNLTSKEYEQKVKKLSKRYGI